MRKRNQILRTTPLQIQIWKLSKYVGYHGHYILTVHAAETRKIIGSLYLHHSSELTLLKLYISLVRPHMEYAVSVWNPKSAAHHSAT